MTKQEIYRKINIAYQELEKAANLGKVAARDAASMIYNNEKHGKGVSDREMRGISLELDASLGEVGQALKTIGTLYKELAECDVEKDEDE